MKKILFIFVVTVMSSCTTYYYQIYQAVPSNKSIVSNDHQLFYEDENCRVSYNLWDEGGNVGFMFYNKTDQNIYINLQESFFVLNGMANNYFKDRVYTTTKGTDLAASGGVSFASFNYTNLFQSNKVTLSDRYTISYNEEKTVCIPAKTSKSISEYKINLALYRDCDLFKFPSHRQIKPKKFDESKSPFIFCNLIAYSLGSSANNLIKLKNEFYVSEITNYPVDEISEPRKDEFCGEKSTLPNEYLKPEAPNRFFIKYKKDDDGMKH
jgi:hypothetical protein